MTYQVRQSEIGGGVNPKAAPPDHVSRAERGLHRLVADYGQLRQDLQTRRAQARGLAPQEAMAIADHVKRLEAQADALSALMDLLEVERNGLEEDLGALAHELEGSSATPPACVPAPVDMASSSCEVRPAAPNTGSPLVALTQSTAQTVVASPTTTTASATAAILTGTPAPPPTATGASTPSRGLPGTGMHKPTGATAGSPADDRSKLPLRSHPPPKVHKEPEVSKGQAYG